MKILVVEDNIKILNSIYDELNNHFDTYKCSDGEEALYQIKQNIYDLIILDLMLPGINGLDILKNIRRNIESLAPNPYFGEIISNYPNQITQEIFKFQS